MIEKYTLTYSYKDTNDTLIINFSNGLSEQSRSKSKNVIVIKNDGKIIGYHVQKFSEIMKIWSKGRIFMPSELFLQIVNNVLINAKLEPLANSESSGYYIGKIIKKLDLDGGYIYQIDLFKETRYCFSRESLQLNSRVVVIKSGATHVNNEIVPSYQLNGYQISAKLCYEDELYLSDKHILITLDNEGQIGDDFFKTEVK